MARPRTFRGNVPTSTHTWDLYSPNLPISQKRKQHAPFLSCFQGAWPKELHLRASQRFQIPDLSAAAGAGAPLRVRGGRPCGARP